jgi:hypothetical protein
LRLRQTSNTWPTWPPIYCALHFLPLVTRCVMRIFGQAKLIRLAHLAGWESGQRIPNPTSRLTEHGVRRSMPKISVPHSFAFHDPQTSSPHPLARSPTPAPAHGGLFLFSSQNHRIFTHGYALFTARNGCGSPANALAWIAVTSGCPICRPTYFVFSSSRRGAVRGLGVAFFRT